MDNPLIAMEKVSLMPTQVADLEVEDLEIGSEERNDPPKTQETQASQSIAMVNDCPDDPADKRDPWPESEGGEQVENDYALEDASSEYTKAGPADAGMPAADELSREDMAPQGSLRKLFSVRSGGFYDAADSEDAEAAEAVDSPREAYSPRGEYAGKATIKARRGSDAFAVRRRESNANWNPDELVDTHGVLDVLLDDTIFDGEWQQTWSSGQFEQITVKDGAWFCMAPHTLKVDGPEPYFEWTTGERQWVSAPTGAAALRTADRLTWTTDHKNEDYRTVVWTRSDQEEDPAEGLTCEEYVQKLRQQNAKLLKAVRAFDTSCVPSEHVEKGMMITIEAFSAEDRMVLCDAYEFETIQWLTFEELRNLKHVEQEQMDREESCSPPPELDVLHTIKESHDVLLPKDSKRVFAEEDANFFNAMYIQTTEDLPTPEEIQEAATPNIADVELRKLTSRSPPADQMVSIIGSMDNLNAEYAGQQTINELLNAEIVSPTFNEEDAAGSTLPSPSDLDSSGPSMEVTKENVGEIIDQLLDSAQPSDVTPAELPVVVETVSEKTRQQILAEAPEYLKLSGGRGVCTAMNGSYKRSHRMRDGKVYYRRIGERPVTIRWNESQMIWLCSFGDSFAFSKKNVAHPGLVKPPWRVFAASTQSYHQEFHIVFRDLKVHEGMQDLGFLNRWKAFDIAPEVSQCFNSKLREYVRNHPRAQAPRMVEHHGFEFSYPINCKKMIIRNRDDKAQKTVELDGIKAPMSEAEEREKFGFLVKDLSEMGILMNQPIKIVQIVRPEQAGRFVVRMTVSIRVQFKSSVQRDLALWLLSEGYAQCDAYASNAYMDAEKSAQEGKKGMWSEQKLDPEMPIDVEFLPKGHPLVIPRNDFEYLAKESKKEREKNVLREHVYTDQTFFGVVIDVEDSRLVILIDCPDSTIRKYRVYLGGLVIKHGKEREYSNFLKDEFVGLTYDVCILAVREDREELCVTLASKNRDRSKNDEWEYMGSMAILKELGEFEWHKLHEDYIKEKKGSKNDWNREWMKAYRIAQGAANREVSSPWQCLTCENIWIPESEINTDYYCHFCEKQQLEKNRHILFPEKKQQNFKDEENMEEDDSELLVTEKPGEVADLDVEVEGKILEQLKHRKYKAGDARLKRGTGLTTLILQTLTAVAVFGDFGTDLVLLKKFHDLGLIGPTVMSMVFILSPYAISYSSGIQLLLLNRYFAEYNLRKRLGLALFLLPFGMLYFFFVDVLTVFFHLFVLMPYCIYHCTDPRDPGVIALKNKVFSIVSMTSVQVQGYERQRAIAGNTFETIPQLLLQTALYMGVFGDKATEEVGFELLIISAGFALFTLYTQFLLVVRESKALLEDGLEYGMICMNGRFGWVPYLNAIVDQRCTKEVLQFDNLIIPINEGSNLKLQMDYYFDDESIRQFIDKLLYFDDKLSTKLSFGISCNFVSIHSMMQLIRASHDKVEEIDLTKVDWQRCIDISVTNHLPLDSSSTEQSMLHEIITYAPDSVRDDIVLHLLHYCKERDPKLLKMVNEVDKSTNATLLMRCVNADLRELARKLLLLKNEIGLDINKAGKRHNPLSLAISLDNRHFVKLLVQYGANRMHRIDDSNRNPFSVLLDMQKFNLLDPLKVNMDTGIPRDIFESLTTALFNLLEARDFEKFRNLEQRFFGESNFKDPDGNTLSHLLALNHPRDENKLVVLFESIEKINKACKDDCIKNNEGLVPLEIAINNGSVFFVRNYIRLFRQTFENKDPFKPSWMKDAGVPLPEPKPAAFIWPLTQVKIKVSAAGEHLNWFKVTYEVSEYNEGTSGKKVKEYSFPTYGGPLGSFLGCESETSQQTCVAFGINIFVLDYYGNFVKSKVFDRHTPGQLLAFLDDVDVSKHIVIAGSCGHINHVRPEDAEELSHRFRIPFGSRRKEIRCFVMVNGKFKITDSESCFMECTFNVTGTKKYADSDHPKHPRNHMMSLKEKHQRNRCWHWSDAQRQSMNYIFIDTDGEEVMINNRKMHELEGGLVKHLDTMWLKEEGLMSVEYDYAGEMNWHIKGDKKVRIHPLQIYIRRIDVFRTISAHICGLRLWYSNDTIVLKGRVEPQYPAVICDWTYGNNEYLTRIGVEMEKVDPPPEVPEMERKENWDQSMRRIVFITNKNRTFIVPKPEDPNWLQMKEHELKWFQEKEDEGDMIFEFTINSLENPCIVEHTCVMAKAPFFSEQKRRAQKKIKKDNADSEVEDVFNKSVAFELLQQLEGKEHADDCSDYEYKYGESKIFKDEENVDAPSKAISTHVHREDAHPEEVKFFKAVSKTLKISGLPKRHKRYMGKYRLSDEKKNERHMWKKGKKYIRWNLKNRRWDLSARDDILPRATLEADVSNPAIQVPGKCWHVLDEQEKDWFPDPACTCHGEEDDTVLWWEQHAPLIERSCEFTLPTKTKPKVKYFNYFEAACRIFTEVVSALDLVTDILIISKMWRHGHVSWTTLSIACVLGPYLIAFSSLNNFFLYRRVFRGSVTRSLLGVLFLSPACLFYFFLMDIAFMIQTILNDLVSILIFREYDSDHEFSDSIFMSIGLTLMDIKGYRRQRTLSQLTFESMPQIILQMYILQQDEADEIGITGGEVQLSIAFAFTHLVFEGCVLYIESKAARMPFFHYIVLCLCGRFGWCPFDHLLHDAREDHEGLRGKVLDYSDMTAHACVTVSLSYQFSRSTLRKLTELIGFLKQDVKKFPQYIIIMDDENISSCSLDDICKLMTICEGRVELVLIDVQWDNLVREHLEKRRHINKDPWQFGKYGEHTLLGHAVEYENYELLRSCLENDCDPNIVVSKSGQSAVHLAIHMNQVGDELDKLQLVKVRHENDNEWVLGQVQDTAPHLRIETLNPFHKVAWEDVEAQPLTKGLDMVKILLESKATLCTTMQDGTTPLDSALDLRANESMLQLLFQHGVEFGPEQEERICDQIVDIVNELDVNDPAAECIMDLVRLSRIIGSLNLRVGTKGMSIHTRLQKDVDMDFTVVMEAEEGTEIKKLLSKMISAVHSFLDFPVAKTVGKEPVEEVTEDGQREISFFLTVQCSNLETAEISKDSIIETEFSLTLNSELSHFMSGVTLRRVQDEMVDPRGEAQFLQKLTDLPSLCAVKLPNLSKVQYVPRIFLEKLAFLKKKNMWPLGILEGKSDKKPIEFENMDFTLDEFKHFYVSMTAFSRHVNIESCDKVASQLGIHNGLIQYFQNTCKLEPPRTSTPAVVNNPLGMNVGFRNPTGANQHGKLRVAEKILELKLQNDVLMTESITLSAEVMYHQVQRQEELPLVRENGFFIVISDAKGSRQRFNLLPVDMSRPKFRLDNYVIPSTAFPALFERLKGGKTVELWISCFRWRPWNLHVKNVTMSMRYTTWFQSITTEQQLVNQMEAGSALNYDIFINFPSGEGVRYVCPPHTQMAQFLNLGADALEISRGDLRWQASTKEAKENLKDLSIKYDLSNNINLTLAVSDRYKFHDPVRKRFEDMLGSMKNVFGRCQLLVVFLPDVFPNATDTFEAKIKSRGVAKVWFAHPDTEISEGRRKAGVHYPPRREDRFHDVMVYKSFVNTYPYMASVFDLATGQLIDFYVPEPPGEEDEADRTEESTDPETWGQWRPRDVIAPAEDELRGADYVAILSYSPNEGHAFQQLHLFDECYEMLRRKNCYVIELFPDYSVQEDTEKERRRRKKEQEQRMEQQLEEEYSLLREMEENERRKGRSPFEEDVIVETKVSHLADKTEVDMSFTRLKGIGTPGDDESNLSEDGGRDKYGMTRSSFRARVSNLLPSAYDDEEMVDLAHDYEIGDRIILTNVAEKYLGLKGTLVAYDDDNQKWTLTSDPHPLFDDKSMIIKAKEFFFELEAARKEDEQAALNPDTRTRKWKKLPVHFEDIIAWRQRAGLSSGPHMTLFSLKEDGDGGRMPLHFRAEQFLVFDRDCGHFPWRIDQVHQGYFLQPFILTNIFDIMYLPPTVLTIGDDQKNQFEQHANTLSMLVTEALKMQIFPLLRIACIPQEQVPFLQALGDLYPGQKKQDEEFTNMLLILDPDGRIPIYWWGLSSTEKKPFDFDDAIQSFAAEINPFRFVFALHQPKNEQKLIWLFSDGTEDTMVLDYTLKNDLFVELKRGEWIHAVQKSYDGVIVLSSSKDECRRIEFGTPPQEGEGHHFAAPKGNMISAIKNGITYHSPIPPMFLNYNLEVPLVYAKRQQTSSMFAVCQKIFKLYGASCAELGRILRTFRFEAADRKLENIRQSYPWLPFSLSQSFTFLQIHDLMGFKNPLREALPIFREVFNYKYGPYHPVFVNRAQLKKLEERFYGKKMERKREKEQFGLHDTFQISALAEDKVFDQLAADDMVADVAPELEQSSWIIPFGQAKVTQPPAQSWAVTGFGLDKVTAPEQNWGVQNQVAMDPAGFTVQDTVTDTGFMVQDTVADTGFMVQDTMMDSEMVQDSDFGVVADTVPINTTSLGNYGQAPEMVADHQWSTDTVPMMQSGYGFGVPDTVAMDMVPDTAVQDTVSIPVQEEVVQDSVSVPMGGFGAGQGMVSMDFGTVQDVVPDMVTDSAMVADTVPMDFGTVQDVVPDMVADSTMVVDTVPMDYGMVQDVVPDMVADSTMVADMYSTQGDFGMVQDVAPNMVSDTVPMDFGTVQDVVPDTVADTSMVADTVSMDFGMVQDVVPDTVADTVPMDYGMNQQTVSMDFGTVQDTVQDTVPMDFGMNQQTVSMDYGTNQQTVSMDYGMVQDTVPMDAVPMDYGMNQQTVSMDYGMVQDTVPMDSVPMDYGMNQQTVSMDYDMVQDVVADMPATTQVSTGFGIGQQQTVSMDSGNAFMVADDSSMMVDDCAVVADDSCMPTDNTVAAQGGFGVGAAWTVSAGGFGLGGDKVSAFSIGGAADKVTAPPTVSIAPGPQDAASPDLSTINKIPGFKFEVKRINEAKAMMASVMLVLGKALFRVAGEDEKLAGRQLDNYQLSRLIAEYLPPENWTSPISMTNFHAGLQIPITAKRNMVITQLDIYLFDRKATRVHVHLLKPKFPAILASPESQQAENYIRVAEKRYNGRKVHRKGKDVFRVPFNEGHVFVPAGETVLLFVHLPDGNNLNFGGDGQHHPFDEVSKPFVFAETEDFILNRSCPAERVFPTIDIQGMRKSNIGNETACFWGRIRFYRF